MVYIAVSTIAVRPRTVEVPAEGEAPAVRDCDEKTDWKVMTLLL